MTQLSRRGFLRAALAAPLAAAAALSSPPQRREYLRFKVAQDNTQIRGQILFTGNILCASPRQMRMLTGIIG